MSLSILNSRVWKTRFCPVAPGFPWVKRYLVGGRVEDHSYFRNSSRVSQTGKGSAYLPRATPRPRSSRLLVFTSAALPPPQPPPPLRPPHSARFPVFAASTHLSLIAVNALTIPQILLRDKPSPNSAAFCSSAPAQPSILADPDRFHPCAVITKRHNKPSGSLRAEHL